jgi:radical SAM superfamily enzyme YgiQ (UPF0313 family)
MELYHNQVTREQGSFSLRMFHRSWGITLIQENISPPTTVLDFPTRDEFARELRVHCYDVVGISSIIVNVGKVREMCRMIREISPRSVIIVGGHVTAIPGIEHILDADHIVKGDGVSWMRQYLGEDPSAPIRHPKIVSGFGLRVLGIGVPQPRGSTAATIIPSAGCPIGCNFCTTSAFFGGKGKVLQFYPTGEELFAVMCEMERSLGAHSFFMMDENFLLNQRRARALLNLMRRHDKSWAMYVFSSANAVRNYSMEELVELGISWIWLGLESPRSDYLKLAGTDTLALARQLRSHGIKLLASTIVGLEHHTPGNIRHEIEHAVSHQADFHQFMLYTPVPGTPLYKQMRDEGRLLDVDLADIHGQHQFNFQHPAISCEDSKRFLDWAFRLDFERNGPSLFRICRTALEGWMRHKNHPIERVRRRFQYEAQALKSGYSAALWAIERRLRESNAAISAQARELRLEIAREFGAVASAWATLLGPVLFWTSKREDRFLASGRLYEPPTIIERRNWAGA